LALILGVPILFAVGSFRLERQQSESDNYLPLYGDTGLEDYIHPEDQVYRLGTIDSVHPSFLYMNQGEGVDGRAIAFFQNYRDVFELIIEDSFEEEDERIHYKAYFYNLYLGIDVNNLNTTLLRLLNLKYMVSQDRDEFQTACNYEAYVDSYPDLLAAFSNRKDGYSKRRYGKKHYSIWGSKEGRNCPSDWQLVDEIELGEPLPGSRSHSQTKLYMYELSNSFERGFLVPNAKLLKSDDAVLNALANETVEGLRSHVYMMGEEVGNSLGEKGSRKEGNLSLASRGTVGQVEIEEYFPDKIVFKVENNQPAFVVISNNFHPKWQARLDGKEVTIHRANHAFQAVYVQNVGEHELVVEFRDPLLWWTHIGLLVGLILFSVGVVVETRLFDALRSTSKVG